jgi:hypothetical protein
MNPDITKLKDYERPDIAERFYRETRNHVLEIKKDDGLYRHLRMMNPKDSSYWYDIVTWPNNLIIRGDGESYAFSRIEDMFSFFRSGWYGGQIHPNLGYWDEKLSSNRECVTNFQEDLFLKELEKRTTELAEGMAPEVEARFREAVKSDITEDGIYSTISEAVDTVEKFEFYTDESKEFDYQHRADVYFCDSWEWIQHCTDYEWWFVWCLYAIVRAIVEYDRVKGHGQAVDVSSMGMAVA